MFSHALCRRPGSDFAAGLTTADLGAPDLDLALAQHAAYVAALEACGLTVRVLEALPGLPDACFVEDAAVILPELVVETRPGASSRRDEVAGIADHLPDDRARCRILPPGCLEGGDVLVVGRRVYVGVTERSNRAGIAHFDDALRSHGYQVTAVPLADGLHLKTSINHLGDDLLLAAPALADHPAFSAHRVLTAPADEGYPCNTLWVNGRLITPAGFAGTRAVLDALELPVIELEMSEFRKMDGGLTCLSLRY